MLLLFISWVVLTDIWWMPSLFSMLIILLNSGTMAEISAWFSYDCLKPGDWYCWRGCYVYFINTLSYSSPYSYFSYCSYYSCSVFGIYSEGFNLFSMD